MIKFDVENKVQDYTFVLSLKTHNHLGQIRNIDPDSVVSKINMNAANELSFTVYKYNEAEYAKAIEKGATEEIALKAAKEPLWDEITDFKYVYVKEIGKKGEYYEIVVDENDEESLYKTITGTSACHTELSQSLVYDLEINTELDIARTDYVDATIFYNELTPEASLLNRVLYKLPQYSIGYVDASLMNIQRTFSFDGTDVLSVLNEISEEIKCLFVFDTVDRSISVYDLMTVCIDCGERGEFSDVCPECGSTDLRYYGEDTTVYIDTENLAENINITVDTESVKNCFKLEAGDENMTAAVVNLNPTGSDYIYYFSEDTKKDMPIDLVEKLESYDALVESYRPEYEEKTEEMYEAIDKIIYYTSGMMPTREDDPTNSKLEAAKLTEDNMSPMGLSSVKSSTSTATVNTALKEYAKIFIKSGYYKVEVNEGDFAYEGTDTNGMNYGYWYGNFKVTNYSDEEDVTISEMIRITINDDFETFVEQKIKKKLSLDDEEKGSIYDVLSIEDLSKFKEALTYYCLNRLTSFYDSVQGCIDIMIEMDLGRENNDLYESMYLPYYDKLQACQEEIDKRQATVDEWGDALDRIDERRAEIQKLLNFEAYLGTDMYKTFCVYKREDKFTNENYISDGLENDEIFKRAKEFLDAAEKEIVKASSHQHQISSTLTNLLCMEEFEPIKDKFEIGNFIRIGIGGKVYRLRLLSYEISFGEIQNIGVEFSDVTKIKNGVSDLQSVINQASSMASTYSAYAHQVESSKEQTSFVKNFVANGFDATAVKIVNNAKNENITMGDAGLLARRKDDFYERYDDTQLKLMSTGVYVTDNNWRSTKSCIGKFVYTDPVTSELVTAYGLIAESIVGNIILGNELGIYSSDGSATMSFDNYGLILNTIGGEDGHYKRILDIQKDGVSQLYIDTDGNIVLATEQMIKTEESINSINAQYANIEKLYVKEATIIELLAKYATIEQLDAVNARIENLDVTKLEADFAEIKKLVATDAEIDNLKAENVTIAGKLSASEAEIDTVKATYAQIGSLEAYKGTIENLISVNAEIESLKAKYIEALSITTDLAKIAQLEAAIAKIENLEASMATIENLTSKTIITESIESNQATIDNLNAKLANIDQAIINIAKIEDLEAANAQIENLNTEYINSIKIDVDDLNAKSATIGQLTAYTLQSEFGKFQNLTTENLTATNATIGKLDANLIEVVSVLAGAVGTGLLQAIHLTADNVVIDDAVIKSAMIDNIDTNIVKIGNDNIIISGSTQQFKDNNGVVRIQIGQDAEGNFTFIVSDEDGSTIIGADGITEKAVPNGLIVDKMISDNAEIEARKIKYIDANGNTTLQTHLEVEQGRIDTLIKETTIESPLPSLLEDEGVLIFDGAIPFVDDNGIAQFAIGSFDVTLDGVLGTRDIKLKDAYLQTVETVDGIQTTITKVETTMSGITSKITEIEATAEGIRTEVSEVSNEVGAVRSIAEQNADKFTWIIKDGTNETDFILTDRTAELVSEQINIKGLVSFSGLDSNTQNKINGNVNKVDVQYALGTSPTIAPESGWSTIAPQWENGKYMWQKTVVTYTDDTKKESDPTCISGSQGQQGEQGDTGVGITSIIEEYYLSASNTSQIGGGWNTVCPSWIDGYYLWTRSVITWADNSTATTDPVLANAINNANNNASQALSKSETANQMFEEHKTLLDSWVSDAIIDGTVTINGGYIKSNTINTDHLIVNDIFSTGNAVMNIINAQEIDAKRITSGYIQANRLDVRGLSVKHSSKINADGEPLETLTISNDGDITLRGTIESYNYEGGSSGWSINPDGNAEFNDVVVRGSVITNDGGIVSSGGSGINLFYNSSFSKRTTQTEWNTELNGNYVANNWGGYNGGVKNPADVYHAHLYELDGEWVYRYVNDDSEWLGITQGVTPDITPGNKYTFSCDIRRPAGSNASIKCGLYATLVGETKASFNSGGTVTLENTLYDTWERVSFTFTANKNIDTSITMGFYIYGHYGDNGIVYMRKPKLEAGDVATAWSLSPSDNIKEVRFWAGSSYEERENAPFVVYNDGSMVATKGTFGGVFTGDIKIGNISIVDPSSTSGNDSILTIQNGNNGIKTVQLTDTSSSKFAQDLLITDNFENSMIELKQDGYINASSGFVIKGNSLTENGLNISGATISGSSASFNIMSDLLNIGTLNGDTDLKIWGNITVDKDAKVNKNILFGNAVTISHNNDGFDINFTDSTLIFTVSFESNGGSAVAPIRDVALNSKITQPSNPTRNGYSFDGWYRDALLNVKFDFSQDVINDNTILYAKWILVPAVAPTYTVTNAVSTTTEYMGVNNWTTPYTINGQTTDGGTLSYHWEINLYEGSSELLAAEDVFASKTSNNISTSELARYLTYRGSYSSLKGKCTITNTKGNTTASVTVSVNIQS